MNKRFSRTCLAVSGALVLAISGCGGGGGGSYFPIGTVGTTPAPTTTTPTATTLSGVAATGAPFAHAALTVTDQAGTKVCDTTTDEKGAYACTLAGTTRAPLAIRAVRDDQTLYGTSATASGVANVSSLTTVIVARLSPEGNPASLAGAIKTTPATVTADTLNAQVAALASALQPLLGALGETTIDPIAGAFSANGTGQDKVLDALVVSVRPDGSAANVEITVKTLPTAADSAPVSIVFRSSDAAIPALPATLTAQDVAPVPAPDVVAAFVSRLTACYALPLSQRIRGASDTTSAIGGAADVSAPACRTLFVGDDPNTYLANGLAVGRDASNQGAFASLFRSGATGLQWDRANVEFFRANGDMVLSYRWTDALGNTDHDTLAARNVGGVLKLAGNTNAYSASVRPLAQRRDLLNTPAFSSLTTGYNVYIDNRVDGAGAPLFSKVLVTAASGEQRVFVPTPGLSYLVVTREDNVTLTSSPVFRLRGEYLDRSTPGNPAEKETALYFASPQYTDSRISALNDQSAWTLEFFHANDAVANVVQAYRTLSRPLTLGEIRQASFVDLTPSMRVGLIGSSAAAGAFTFGAASQAKPNIVDFSSDGNVDAWTVPPGALAPTSFIAYGRAPFGSSVAGQAGARFNDATGVASLARKTVVRCSKQTAMDLHCDTSFGFPQYAQGTTLNSFELWVRSARQVEMSKIVGLYKLQ
ncbi:carboxypeptidase regulatory-like domain-containing protein [Variovorax rhizosphaerae]|uniref:Carboxypeptidase regulatory-like domain-containing protein n=1 Tax=Variovorax rhizosphaerae TaxID=1836200 RepID=A0ABU8WF92_9BURK